MTAPRVYLFVDNSNIFISAKETAQSREGRAAKDAVRIQFENLIQLALSGRQLAKAFVVGSVPPEQRTVWDRLTQKTGIVPELYERGSLSGGEQGLDQCLQVHMLRALSDNPEPQVAVLLTGDGAGYDDGVGFHADMARMHAAGWGIEVLSWERSCRKALRDWAKANGCFVRLDDYYEAITFLESGRRSGHVDLSLRPTAQVRQSPSQVAARDARLDADKEIAELRRELAKATSKEAAKAAGRENFLKRQARQQKPRKG